ncbi:MAG TPA: amino acid adenylation domain-containing protein, partial [Yinghuangia sp.]|nr:amino acid adenylation domain-containing protein [Yinghuangia sp.]
LAQKLPAQLVPGAFVVLDELPLNPNGKVDRAALPAPGARASSAERRAPADTRERALHAVFAEFLRLPPDELGVDDDFFALGGHSLLAARVANRIRGELRVEVSVADVFNAPTVAALARLAADAPPVRPRVRDFAHAAPTADATDSLRATRPVEAPASFAQAGLWFDEHVRGSSAAYCLPLGVRLRGAVDPEALRAALRDVVARHEALRTVLCAGPDALPVQRVLPVADSAARLRFDVVEAATWPAERLDAEISALVARPFRLDTDIPVRAGLFLRQEPDGTPASVLVLVLHHAAADRWSFTPLLADLARAYESRRGGRPLPAGDVPPVRYTAYSAWQRALLGERDRPTALAEQQLAYWEETLRGAPAETPLPADRPRPATPSHRGGNVLHTLSPALTDAVRRIAHDTGASVFMVLHAGVAALLHRHGSGSDIVLGAPVSGRTDEDLDDVVGFFVNSVVLRTDIGGNPTFADLVARVRTADLAAFAHADIPFERVVDRLHPERSAARHPVFQVMIAHHRAEEVDFSLTGADAEAFLPTSTAAMFDLDLRFVETGNDGIAVHAGYATDLFDHDTVTRLLARLTHLLDAVTKDPSLRVSEAPVLPTAESEALLRDSVGATRPIPAGTVVDRVAEQATRTPAAAALVDATSTTTTTISYAELDARANRLARLLIAEGAGPGRIVAVAVPRSPALVVALLAVLKSGAAYLPIDLDHPDHRIAGTIADAAPSFTVTSSAHAARMPGRLVVCDSPEHTERLGDFPDSPVGDADRVTPLLAAHPAYVMYTSGSTGRPKGVVVPHQALANQLAWVQNEYELTGHDRMLHKSPIGFDVSIWELFWPLCAGAAVVLAAPDGHRDPAYLAAALIEHRVSAVHFVPPVLDAVLTAIETENQPGAVRPPELRLLLCGGEALPPRTAIRSERVLGLTPHNTYGPTEATITATAWAPGTGNAQDVVPIGRPVWNTGALVLDERLRLAPVGRTGELYLTGAGLADGYLNRRGLTAERFTANPFGAPGERMYRTGDLVRRRADGALVFVGRTDTQVKLRGVRIELGEIEAELASRQDVRTAVVMSRPGPTGAQRLIAYVVPSPGTSPDAETVRGETAERLPEHMVPAAVVVLDALPTTATGKTDFAALPEPERTEQEAAVPPSGPVEEALARLFADVLKVDAVGAKESFFSLGGDSIGATLLAARARKAGLRFTVRDVFRHPSVAALARVVVTDPKPETAASTPAWPPAEPGRDAARDAVPTTTAEPRVVPAPPLLHILRDQAGVAGPRGCHVAVLRGIPTGSARWDRLGPASTELARRHDALRLTVTPVSRRLWRTTAAPAGVSDTHADVTVAEPVDPSALADVVRREVRRAADQLDLTAARTLRVVGIPGTAGAADHLLVIAHPLALDEASVERIAHELATAVDESGAAIGSNELPSASRPTATPDAREATGTGTGTGTGVGVGVGVGVGTSSGTSDVAWWVEALRDAVAVEPPVAEQFSGAASDPAA